MVAEGPACPRCGGKETTPLAREEDRQRHQCVKCSENFWAPAAPVEERPAPTAVAPKFSYAPIAPMEPSQRLRGCDPVETCPKCPKPYYKAGKRFEAHVAACDGKPFVQPKRRATGGARKHYTPPDPTKVYDQQLASLLARKASLEAEVRGIESAIGDIQKMRGAGGAAPLPFTVGTSLRLSTP